MKRSAILTRPDVLKEIKNIAWIQRDIKNLDFIMGANLTKEKRITEDSEALVSEIPKPVRLPICQDEPDVIEPTELGDSMIGDGLLFCNLFIP